jgi:hypothetical protein
VQNKPKISIYQNFGFNLCSSFSIAIFDPEKVQESPGKNIKTDPGIPQGC